MVAEKFGSTASAEALTTMQDFLQAHPDVKAVYAFNGPIAIGAVQALRAAGKKPGDVMVLTTDMEAETQRLIKDGWIPGNCRQPASDHGGTCGSACDRSRGGQENS